MVQSVEGPPTQASVVEWNALRQSAVGSAFGREQGLPGGCRRGEAWAIIADLTR